MYEYKARKVLISFIVLIFTIMTLIPLISSDLSVVSASVASNKFTEEFDEEDLIITVAMHVLSEPDYDVIPRPTIIEPLYNLADEITAYDVTMSDNSYMVVNANRENPVVLEFGDGILIKPDSTNNTKTKNYYIGPGITAKRDISNNNFTINIGVETTDIKTDDIIAAERRYMAICKESNLAVKSVLENTKATLKILQSLDNPTTSGDIYDLIIGLADLPPLTTLTSKKDIPCYYFFIYGTTSRFQGVNGAANHCGATSAYNMVAYYRCIYGDDIAETNMNTVFTAIHKRVGSALGLPVMPFEYRRGLKGYIEKDTNYKITITDLNTQWATYKAEIDANRMTALCIFATIIQAHYVNGIGYKIFSNGTCYARVIDNWTGYNPITDPIKDVPEKYYLYNSGVLYDVTRVYIYK